MNVQHYISIYVFDLINERLQRIRKVTATSTDDKGEQKTSKNEKDIYGVSWKL